MPLLFLHIGWMEHYKGLAADDPVLGGGKNPAKGEVCNFRPYGGRYYGYASAGPHRTIDVGRLGAEREDGHVDGVDVVGPQRTRAAAR